MNTTPNILNHPMHIHRQSRQFLVEIQHQLMACPDNQELLKTRNDLIQIINLSQNIQLTPEQYQNPKYSVGEKCMAPADGIKKFAEATITSIGVDGFVTFKFTKSGQEGIATLDQLEKAKKKKRTAQKSVD